MVQGEIARSMQPLPGPLVDAAQRLRPRELYWVIREGIKMSGMPAWGYRLSDADHWALVGFLQRLPALTPAAFAPRRSRGPMPCVSGRDGAAEQRRRRDRALRPAPRSTAQRDARRGARHASR